MRGVKPWSFSPSRYSFVAAVPASLQVAYSFIDPTTWESALPGRCRGTKRNEYPPPGAEFGSKILNAGGTNTADACLWQSRVPARPGNAGCREVVLHVGGWSVTATAFPVWDGYRYCIEQVFWSQVVFCLPAPCAASLVPHSPVRAGSFARMIECLEPWIAPRAIPTS